MKNVADPSQVKNAERKAKDLRKTEIEDVKHVLSTVAGRRFFWRYLGVCGVFQSSFTGSSETFFREGQRNVGLKLMSDLNDADPNVYSLMLRENNEKGDI